MLSSGAYVIILAGGIGNRFGAPICKQFQYINSVPVIVKTINKFLEQFDVDNIRLVVHKEHELYWRQIYMEFPYLKEILTVYGGETRFHSVKNALDSICPSQANLIGIHDGVRPLVSTETITIAFETAEKFGTAVPFFDAVNTIRIERGNGNEAINRQMIKVVQNPQVFQYDVLKDAYDQHYSAEFLDDATVVESAGYEIKLCQGNYENIKITHPQDICIAEALDNYITENKNNGHLHDNGTVRYLQK